MPSKRLHLKCVTVFAFILMFIYYHISGLDFTRDYGAWVTVFYNQRVAKFNLLLSSVNHDTSQLSDQAPSNLDSETKIALVVQRLRTRAQMVTSHCERQSKALQFITHTDLKIKPVETMLFLNKKHKLLYWAIPKIGSSFWKRILKVLDSSNKAAIKMFDLTNMAAHKSVPPSIVFSKYNDSDRVHMMETFTKFYFVRDPYARLFSAYVDKMFIPTVVGLSLTHQMVLSGILTNSSCPWKVSFADLCLYVAATIFDVGKLEDHFAPISYHQPCTFNVTMLGKMETFVEDSRALLASVNISVTEIAGNISDLDTENEMGYIKDISLRTILYIRDLNCLSQINALRRQWAVFQIRGYILKSIQFPFSPLEDTETVLMKFTQAAITAYRQSGSPEVRHKQREEAMLEAYATLPEVTLQMLEKSMKQDCLLFGYSCDIRDKVKGYTAVGRSPRYFDIIHRT